MLVDEAVAVAMLVLMDVAVGTTVNVPTTVGEATEVRVPVALAPVVGVVLTCDVAVTLGVGSCEPAQNTPVIVPPKAVLFTMVPLTLAKKMLSVYTPVPSALKT